MLLIFSHPLRTRVWRPSGRIPSAVAVGQIEAEPRAQRRAAKLVAVHGALQVNAVVYTATISASALQQWPKALQLFED